MNTQATQAAAAPADSTALVARTSIVKVEAALAEFDAIEAGLAELRTKYAGVVFDMKSTAGMKEAIAARAAVREPRYKTEHARKAGKAPVLTLGQNIQDRAAYITDELMQIEEPIHAQITAEEARREAEKEAKRQAEQERIAKIQAAIDEIKSYGIDSIGKPAATITVAMELLEQSPIDERFGEFKDLAERAKVDTMNRLNTLHAAAVGQEAESARIAAERAELERQKAEQVERERVEAARIAQEAQERANAEAATKARLEIAEEAAAARIAAAEEESSRRQELAAAEAKAQADRLEKERLAKEARDRAAQEKIEAKARAKREKEESAERARLAKAQEKMDARQMLDAFVTRFGHLPEFAEIVKAIEALPPTE